MVYGYLTLAPTFMSTPYSQNLYSIISTSAAKSDNELL